ncbi:MAG TPA: transglycosylase SLT domain-containing protein, partial [Clostridia bacterium]|nr:transglycosylase SLT domain-containing protein [Clostridia bacterium]
AVVWAMRIAYCESRYHPNSVNTDSGATGLFQFMAGTWSGTPWASKSRFDPVANAQAAAWLYSHYGPGRWSCK